MSAVAILPYMKTDRQPETLSFVSRPTNLKQSRTRDRICLEPNIDMEAFRFNAVVDWIEIKIFLGQTTQHQHCPSSNDLEHAA